MSDPVWRAALVQGAQMTVWPMSRDGGRTGPARTLPRDALADLPGPVVAAGLDVTPRPVPAMLDTRTAHVPGAPHVAAIPMLRQDSPAALSRGAETAIAGHLLTDPDFDGVLVILGEETCWAHISAREVVSFQTFLTPGLMRCLAAETKGTGPDFVAALDATLSRPERLAQHLSSARATGSGQEAAHLIGAEIAAARPYWLGQAVVLLGDAETAAPYRAALRHQGGAPGQGDLETVLLAGFGAAWAALHS